MYLHLGQNTLVRDREIIGIFDLDITSQSLRTRQYLAAAEQRGQVELERVERLGGITGCTHAAVWVRPDGSFAGGAEDVGRHVAASSSTRRPWLP